MLRITEAREMRGWSQEKLANAVGTTQQTIQRWEAGKTDPQISKIKAISNALNVTVSYLLGIDRPDANTAEGQLSTDERELVALYRSANPQGRAAIMAVAQASQGVAREAQGHMNTA